ncbi:DUF397 domain-containing protein [Herbidospora daliensis]|uniref:DUF397 domain-containing protein n=1 Tax=Herbidospora daliensis TaxID=295585 RepID=UPI000780D86D|nr:DUF397 domain-containing protein [Herbidospora daliensis]
MCATPISEDLWIRACSNNDCVEVSLAGDRVKVRDSKRGDGGAVLDFTPEEWRAFVDGVRRGVFDV